MIEFSEYWNNYQDWKYPVTVVFCVAVGYLAGWFNHKDKCRKMRHAEALRLATTNTIEKPVHLEDVWQES